MLRPPPITHHASPQNGRNQLTDIVLDAMGSDKAPEPEVRGAILACREYPVRVHLVGPEARLRQLLNEHLQGERLPIEIVNATERIGMDEKAAVAVRNKLDSSMRVGLKLVREKRAHGFLTAGNTGAAMATAKMVLRALPGVDRPALTAILPTSSGSPCVLLDVGANVECKAHNLEQFAVMGEMYSRSVLKIARPRVGLLSIGEEESKGNELTRESYGLLKQLPINFIGNVEGRDIFNGNADVVVCDGFVGNVALKTSEGLARLVSEMLRASLDPDGDRPGRSVALPQGPSRIQEAPRLSRIRRSAAARRPRRLHRRPRLVQRPRHHERNPRRRRVRPGRASTTASSGNSPSARLLRPSLWSWSGSAIA